MFSIGSARKVGTLVLAAFLCFPEIVAARGVSPYLPLHMSPEIERQIEQVLLFAGQPVVGGGGRAAPGEWWGGGGQENCVLR